MDDIDRGIRAASSCSALLQGSRSSARRLDAAPLTQAHSLDGGPSPLPASRTSSIRSTHLRFRAGDAEPMAKAPGTDVMGGAIPSGHGTSGTVRAESVATRASVCSRRAGGRRSVPATRVPPAARKSPAPPPQQRSRGRTRRIRGAYFEPLSATRRGPSTAMSHASRSTNSSTKWARILRVLPLLGRLRRSSGKTPSRSSEPKRREPQRLLRFPKWS